jgi:hypothetical protein
MFILLLLYILGRGIAWERVRAGMEPAVRSTVQNIERRVSSAGRRVQRGVEKAVEGIRRNVDKYLR